MRGVYTINVQSSGILGGRTLLWAEPPSDRVVEILSASITNLDNDTSEQCEAGIYRIKSHTVGEVVDGTTYFEKHELGDPACSIMASGTVNGAAGEPVYSGAPIDRRGFNILAGYYYDPIPEERPVLSPGVGVGIRLLAGAGTTATTYDTQLVIREIGG